MPNLTKVIYLLRPTFLYRVCGGLLETLALRQWQRGKNPPAPGRIKVEMIRALAERYQLRTLVETGTFFGDTVAALTGAFGRIFTIELAPKLCALARDRFRQHPNVQVIEGDSGVELPRLLPTLSEPCLFWLDGHFSGGVTARGEIDTPVLAELSSLLRNRSQADVILIDDARLFGVDPGYPAIEAVRALVSATRPGWGFEVSDDVVRIAPPPVDRAKSAE